MQEFKVKGHESSYLPDCKKWKLVWSDEFDGSELDRTKWDFRLNFWGWRHKGFLAEGVDISDSCLKLSIVKNADGSYGSPHLQTCTHCFDNPKPEGQTGFWPFAPWKKPLFLHSFGYYEVYCRPNLKPGWWSAFWLQSPCIGAHPDPRFGGIECDIMESQDYPEKGMFRCGNIWGGYGKDSVHPGHAKYIPENRNNHWFRFGVDWSRNGYTFYCDGREVHQETRAVSHTDQFILLSTECIGTWRNPLNHENGTHSPLLEKSYPDSFEVDYVRVFDEIRE